MSVQRVLPRDSDQVRNDQRAIQQSATDGIRRGNQGRDVEALQRELSGAGFYDERLIDGDFGPVTQGAVRAFQKAKGLPETGVVNRETAEALKANDLFVQPHFADPAHRGQKGKDILGMERKLNALGYDTGKVDGKFTQNTVRAVRAFRADDNVLPDDNNQIDGQFRERLNRKYNQNPLAAYDRTPPRDNYSRISRDGETINRRTNEMIARAEKIMQQKFGHEGFHFNLTQGSYSTDVSASAGTHAGGGALDITDRQYPQRTVDHMVQALREAGFAAWSRGRGHDSFSPHIHAIAIGDRELSSAARNQVREYGAGGDGLTGSSPDPDRGLGRDTPEWARRFL